MPYPTPFGGYGFCATSMDPHNPKNLTAVNGQVGRLAAAIRLCRERRAWEQGGGRGGGG